MSFGSQEISQRLNELYKKGMNTIQHIWVRWRREMSLVRFSSIRVNLLCRHLRHSDNDTSKAFDSVQESSIPANKVVPEWKWTGAFFNAETTTEQFGPSILTSPER
jgi:hypothetical protein